ncbi:MAG: glucosaminidase domain-containing protein [Sphingomonadales bacterium]
METSNMSNSVRDTTNRSAMSAPLSIAVMLSLLTSFVAIGQRQEAIEDYISKYETLAVAEMQRTGVPASIKLAQGIHETQAGTSQLVQRSNNHFGIKCKTGWSGPSVRHDDDARAECFRKYETPEASYVDHSNFLKNSPRYFSLFELPPTDYQGWAWGLKKAGYATNPQYAQTLIKLIEEYDLNRYTLLALGKSLNPASPSTVPSTVPSVATSASPVAEPPTPPLPKVITTATSEPSQSIASPSETRYPSGVFEKDGCRAVWVRAGTPFLAIADQYKIPLSKLFSFNGMEPVLQAQQDQLLLLERRANTPIRWPLRNKRSS